MIAGRVSSTVLTDPHFIDREDHDKIYDEWPNVVLHAEQSGVDEISIVRRDNSILFDNRLDRKKGQGGWLKPMGAYEVLMLERHRRIWVHSNRDVYIMSIEKCVFTYIFIFEGFA